MSLLSDVLELHDAYISVTQSLDLRSLFALANASKDFDGFAGKFACGQVWVVGQAAEGEGGNPVMCYDVHLNIWEARPALPMACDYVHVVEMNHEIYVLGWLFKEDEDDDLGTMFVVFDRHRRVWSDLGKLPLGEMNYQVVVLHDYIYIIGDLPSYNQDEDDVYSTPVRIARYCVGRSWDFLPPWPSTYHCVSMVPLNGMLYLVGADEYMVYFEQFDPISGEWTDLSPSVDEDIEKPLAETLHWFFKEEVHVVAISEGILVSRLKKREVLDYSKSPTSCKWFCSHEFWFYSPESGKWTREDLSLIHI